MAKLVDIWRNHPVSLTRRQMPLIVDENLTMIMDLSHLGYINESPQIRGKQLDAFMTKFNMLTKEEIKASFEVSTKDLVTTIGQTVPCIGCRRSVERLFYDLMQSGHQALDPLTVTVEGILTIKDEILESPKLLCTMLHGHSARLNSLLERQPRSKKSCRCALHSLEVQRTRPPAYAWREVWDVMKPPCRQEVTLVEADTLESTLEAYLRKHRFCVDCRTKVLLASTLLTTEKEPTKEKGYVPSLYAGIKRCLGENHVHLPTNTEYIRSLIEKAQPEIIGRERHAKTLDIAQEEVLTCLGICVAERLYRVHRRLREEETVCRLFAAVAVDALSRNFEVAVEVKQGISQLELLYKELTREEIIKEQRREKLRLKRKKKKERKYENAEEKENKCDCLSKKDDDDVGEDCTCLCIESKPTTHNNDRHKLQILDPKNKGQPTCVCPDCQKKAKTGEDNTGTISKKIQSLSAPTRKKSLKKITAKVEQKTDVTNDKIDIKNKPSITPEDSSELYRCCDDEDRWYIRDDAHKMLLEQPAAAQYKKIGTLKDYEIMSDLINRRESSEPLSQDYGYSSEHVSSPSMPSSPEGSEVACSEGCCTHDRPLEKFDHSMAEITSVLGTKTLSQMLEASPVSDDDVAESYIIPAEEVQKFTARMCQIHKERQELRQNLRKRFAQLCSGHYKQFRIPH